MFSDKFIQWLTFFTMVIGIALVVYELRSTKEFVRIQLGADAYNYIGGQSQSIPGEDVASSLARACESDPLTTEDTIILSTWFNMIVQRVNRVEFASGPLFSQDAWIAPSRRSFATLFSTPAGRIWWGTHK